MDDLTDLIFTPNPTTSTSTNPQPNPKTSPTNNTFNTSTYSLSSDNFSPNRVNSPNFTLPLTPNRVNSPIITNTSSPSSSFKNSSVFLPNSKNKDLDLFADLVNLNKPKLKESLNDKIKKVSNQTKNGEVDNKENFSFPLNWDINSNSNNNKSLKEVDKQMQQQQYKPFDFSSLGSLNDNNLKGPPKPQRVTQQSVTIPSNSAINPKNNNHSDLSFLDEFFSPSSTTQELKIDSINESTLNQSTTKISNIDPYQFDTSSSIKNNDSLDIAEGSDWLLDGKLAELVGLGYDLEQSKLALQLSNEHDVLEAKEIMDTNVKALNQLQPNNQLSSDDEEETNLFVNKSKLADLLPKGQIDPDHLINQASELGASVVSVANKWLFKGKQQLSSTWSELKSRHTSGTSSPSNNTNLENESDDEEGYDVRDYDGFKDDDYEEEESLKDYRKKDLSFNSTLNTPINIKNSGIIDKPIIKPQPKKEVKLPHCDIFATSDQINQSDQYRKIGTNQYKLGQYDLAFISYKSALNSLPINHYLTISILTNLSITSLKLGDYQDCIKFSNLAINLVGDDKYYQPLKEGLDGKAGLDLKGLYQKALIRLAEGLEGLEKFKQAEEIWIKVEGNKGVEGVRRCKKGLEPIKEIVIKKPVIKLNNISSIDPKDSLRVQQLRQQQKIQHQIEMDNLNHIDDVNQQIKSWEQNKKNNLRALLSSIHVILGEEVGIEKVDLLKLMDDKGVKKYYFKVISKLHPDKLSSTLPTNQKLLAQHAFTILNRAYLEFKTTNNI